MNNKLNNQAAELRKQLEELEAKQAKIESTGGFINFRDTSAKGVVKPTFGNTKQLIDHYNISIRHNEMTKDLEISFPNRKFHRDTELNTAMSYFKSLARDQDLPVTDIFDHIGIVANDNHYHPVRDWIDSVEWDGKDRLKEFYNTIQIRKIGTAEDIGANTLKETLMRKWAISAVAALYYGNFSCEGVLTFYGKQAIGKSSWTYSLVPREVQSKWIKDAVTLDVGNKDSVMKAVSTWITELGELDATFRKSDLEALKGFITERVDILRPPYERKANSYSRRTVFYATINTLEFLQDDENRRFWTLDVEKVYPCQFDVQQFWAEMKVLYEAVEPLCRTAADRERNQEWGWFLTPDERMQLQTAQRKFQSIDPISEMLANRLTPADEMKTGQWLNCTAILQECGMMHPDKRATNAASKWLRAQGFDTKVTSKAYFVNVKDRVIAQLPPSLKLIK